MRIAKLLKDTLTLILAGGQGERLSPLTRDRAKPAVPFGGHYRIIDFTLSNCINSGLKRIYVLTQYKSQSLDDHLRLGWNIFASAFLNFCFRFLPSSGPEVRGIAGQPMQCFRTSTFCGNDFQVASSFFPATTSTRWITAT